MAIVYSLQDAFLSLERINEIHNMMDEDNECNLNPPKGSTSPIVFSNVSFKYDENSKDITINDISLDIPENKMTAIVGASGSGKTTLIKLMLGFYPVSSGDIYVYDKPISSYNMHEWRKQCGTVLQDSVIFPDIVARNIAVSDGKIDYNRVLQAAKLACIDSFVMELPNKYQTKIGNDGIGLSQGQKQRILIARAIYKNPKYIFFDEATNALDAKNEQAIVANLYEFFKGKTVVVAAHRLSSIRRADQIIVMDKGSVVEKGTHVSLIKEKGIYYNLVKTQLELIDD